MNHPNCRIGRVRYKGASNIEVLIAPRPMGIGQDMAREARRMAGHDSWRNMAGWVIVAWTHDGCNRAISFQPNGPIPRTLVPCYCEEIIRRDLLYGTDEGLI
jgi:hypothetical protein